MPKTGNGPRLPAVLHRRSDIQSWCSWTSFYSGLIRLHQYCSRWRIQQTISCCWQWVKVWCIRLQDGFKPAVNIPQHCRSQCLGSWVLLQVTFQVVACPCRSVAVSTISHHNLRSYALYRADHIPRFCCFRSFSIVRHVRMPWNISNPPLLYDGEISHWLIGLQQSDVCFRLYLPINRSTAQQVFHAATRLMFWCSSTPLQTH